MHPCLGFCMVMDGTILRIERAIISGSKYAGKKGVAKAQGLHEHSIWEQMISRSIGGPYALICLAS